MERQIKSSLKRKTISMNDFEICSKCGYQISRSEQAFVFNGDIVCLECDNILRGEIKETEDISNNGFKNMDIAQTKGEEEINVDTVMNDSGIAYDQLLSEDKLEISDHISSLDPDDKALFNGSDTKEDYVKDSDNLLTDMSTDDISSVSNSKDDCQKVQIQLPSFIHSCFIDRDLSTVGPQLKKNYRSVGGFVILLCIVGIVAVGAVLVTRYLL